MVVTPAGKIAFRWRTEFLIYKWSGKTGLFFKNCCSRSEMSEVIGIPESRSFLGRKQGREGIPEVRGTSTITGGVQTRK